MEGIKELVHLGVFLGVFIQIKYPNILANTMQEEHKAWEITGAEASLRDSNLLGCAHLVTCISLSAHLICSSKQRQIGLSLHGRNQSS